MSNNKLTTLNGEEILKPKDTISLFDINVANAFPFVDTYGELLLKNYLINESF